MLGYVASFTNVVAIATANVFAGKATLLRDWRITFRFTSSIILLIALIFSFFDSATFQLQDFFIGVISGISGGIGIPLAYKAFAKGPVAYVSPLLSVVQTSAIVIFAAATGDVVLYTDADLPFDMREVHKALRLMGQYEADLVAAYRFDRTGEGYVRVIYSFFYNLLVRVLFGCRFRDVNFAFKLVRRTVLDRVELHSEGSFIDAELMVSARKMGMNVVQFGVDYFPRTRGVSTLSSPSVIVKILREAFALRSSLNALESTS